MEEYFSGLNQSIYSLPVGDIEALANALAATLDEVTYPDVKMRATDFSVDVVVDKYLKVLGISR